ncbi:MAG: LytR/AlgR family response regulator transcription factor [Traorella sp.]
MRVAVLDDNLAFLSDIKNRLQQDLLISEVSVFENPKKLLNELENNVQFDLLLLDIDFKNDETGLDIGEKIYHLIPELPIIYITGYNDRYAQHLLLTNSNLLGYITKPVDDHILKQYLQKAVQFHANQAESLIVSIKNQKFAIKIKDIIYIESDDHKVTIYTEEKSYTLYQKLSELIKELPSQFEQCHKSFLVNMKWIHSIEYKTVNLRNGKQIPISRTYREKFQNNFFKFLRNV